MSGSEHKQLRVGGKHLSNTHSLPCTVSWTKAVKSMRVMSIGRLTYTEKMDLYLNQRLLKSHTDRHTDVYQQLKSTFATKWVGRIRSWFIFPLEMNKRHLCNCILYVLKQLLSSVSQLLISQWTDRSQTSFSYLGKPGGLLAGITSVHSIVLLDLHGLHLLLDGVHFDGVIDLALLLLHPKYIKQNDNLSKQFFFPGISNPAGCYPYRLLTPRDSLYTAGQSLPATGTKNR